MSAKARSMGVLGASFAFFTVSTFVSSTARAQATADELCPKFRGLFGQGQAAGMVHGTVGRATALSAISRNAQIYGVANEMGRTVLPMLDAKESGAVLHFGLTTTFNALRVPTCQNFQNEYKHSYDLQLLKVDLGTFTMGIGARSGPFSIYYGVSSSVHVLSPDGPTRIFTGMSVPFLAAGIAPFVAPFKRDFVRDDFSLTLDYIAGLQYHSPVGAIGVGYLGSRGIFTNFSEKTIRAFVGVVINRLEDVASIPYLAAGFESFDWLVGDDVAKSIGHTKLFGRKLQLPAAPGPGAALDATSTRGTKPSDFVTGHLEQTGIARYVDLNVTYAAKPQPSLYELSTGFRIADDIRLSRDPSSSKGRQSGDVDTFFRLLVGFVKLPDLWFYGVQGGYKARVAIQTSGFIPWAPEAGYVPLVLGIGLNDPEILSAFPYAYNAVQFTMRLGLK